MIAKAATYQDVLYVVAVFSWSFMSIKPSPEILFFNGSESFKKNLSRGGWGGGGGGATLDVGGYGNVF